MIDYDITIEYIELQGLAHAIDVRDAAVSLCILGLVFKSSFVFSFLVSSCGLLLLAFVRCSETAPMIWWSCVLCASLIDRRASEHLSDAQLSVSSSFLAFWLFE